MPKTITPADRIADIERGVRRTLTNLLADANTAAAAGDDLRTRRLAAATIDIDHDAQTIHQLTIDAQLRTLRASADPCQDLLDRATRTRERSRARAVEARA